MPRPPGLVPLLAALVPALLAPALGAAQPAPAGSSVEPWSYEYLDPDGEPLPFSADDELLEFLRSAEVVSSRPIGRGITNPKRLLLDRDGVRAHAVFRYVEVRVKNEIRRFRGLYLFHRDHYLFEVAAYELDRLLHLGRVPPATARTVNGVRGSVQMWLEQTIMDVNRRDLGLEAPSQGRWYQQQQTLALFDNIIGNADRNLGNVLIDRGWSLWFIDHSRCFVPADKPLYPERVTHCERRLWRALQELDEAELRQTLEPYLLPYEMNALVARWRLMVAHVQRLIDDRGEALVLFDPLPAGPEPVTWPED
jgi:hypothetical protein